MNDKQVWERWRMYDAIYIVSMILGSTIAGILFGLAAGVFV